MRKGSIALLLLIASVFFAGCNEERKFKSRRSEEGYRLATAHCKSCHQFPEADLLDKQTWATYVLPKMSSFLGFRYMQGGSYFENGSRPEAMPLADWKKIVSYYVQESPDATNNQQQRPAIEMRLKHFSPVMPAFRLHSPATTFIKIVPAQQVLLADGSSQNIYSVTGEGTVLDSVKVAEGVVHIQMDAGGLQVLSMGLLHPSDEKAGKLTTVDFTQKQTQLVLDSLQRPVYIEYADLNKDGLTDIVLCEFGNTLGQLSWYENTGNKQYKKHVLRPLPGATRTQLLDVNRDGNMDIIALMAQGDEGFFIYYNKRNGQFTEQRVLRFSPSHGSNYFELADFNGDGYQDILATNGDNGDYPPILKSYHGVRVYLNDRKNNFREKVFLSMNGASKAMARDFDKDGDLDIAAVSYFPDYDHRPQESFVYWENNGGFSFKPYSFPQAAAGRWLTMDAGDIDGDGDEDIVLGNAKFTLGTVPEAIMQSWSQNAPSFVILKNTK
jgi:hypothetical protein